MISQKFKSTDDLKQNYIALVKREESLRILQAHLEAILTESVVKRPDMTGLDGLEQLDASVAYMRKHDDAAAIATETYDRTLKGLDANLCINYGPDDLVTGLKQLDAAHETIEEKLKKAIKQEGK